MFLGVGGFLFFLVSALPISLVRSLFLSLSFFSFFSFSVSLRLSRSLFLVLPLFLSLSCTPFIVHLVVVESVFLSTSVNL